MFNPFEAILIITQFIVLLTFHEWGHAKSADMLGDATARHQGRMSLNPAVHIDLIGTILLPLLGTLFGSTFFGWAKPVPVNPFNLKNPRRDLMFIAAAGPFMNIVLTFAILGIARFSELVFDFPQSGSQLHAEIARQWRRMGLISVFLAAFNMLPIYPLDGFSVVRGLLPARAARQWENLSPYGMPILMCLIFLPGLLGIPNFIFGFLAEVSYATFYLIAKIVGLR